MSSKTIKTKINNVHPHNHSFETRPGVEPSWVEKRIEEEKTQWVDLVKNPVATR